jgi:hypothetical protein
MENENVNCTEGVCMLNLKKIIICFVSAPITEQRDIFVSGQSQ